MLALLDRDLRFNILDVLDLSAQVGKTQLVPAGAGVGKRGRGAGFYCEACDLTFKDNKQFVEHLNTMQHLVNTGQNSQVRRATAEEVHERIARFVQRREDPGDDEQQAAAAAVSMARCGLCVLCNVSPR